MSEWKEYKLGDLLEITSSKRIMRSDYVSNGIPFFRSKEIIELNKGSEISTELFISEEQYLKIKSKFGVPVTGDILLTSVGTLGVPYIVQEQDRFYFKDGNLTWFRNFKPILNSKFLFYWLSFIGRRKIKDIAIGSTQQALTIISLKQLVIDLPPLDKQLEVVNILDNITRKIHLNTQTNQTLEQIAQAIYKSWFVDYEPTRAKAAVLAADGSKAEAESAAMRAISGKTAADLATLKQQHPARYQQLADLAAAFPTALTPTDGFGDIPAGWEISTIDESYSVVMGQSPSGETYNEEGQGTLFYQGRAEFGERFPRPRLYTTAPKRMAQKDDVLMSVRAPVGDLNVALEDCCIGRGLAALRHKSGSFSFGLYQIQSLKPALDLFNSEGTVFGSINQKDLKAINVLQPADMIISLFNGICLTIDKQIQNNTQQNILLSETRDIMLPKLLNGDIEA